MRLGRRALLRHVGELGVLFCHLDGHLMRRTHLLLVRKLLDFLLRLLNEGFVIALVADHHVRRRLGSLWLRKGLIHGQRSTLNHLLHIKRW